MVSDDGRQGTFGIFGAKTPGPDPQSKGWVELRFPEQLEEFGVNVGTLMPRACLSVMNISLEASSPKAYFPATPALGLERLLMMFNAIDFDGKADSIVDNGVIAFPAAMLGRAKCWFGCDVGRGVDWTGACRVLIFG